MGTPDDAIARIQRVIDHQGEIGCVLLQTNDWADWDQTRRSLDLYARYVLPHFSAANANRAASYGWVTANQAELIEKLKRAAREMFEKHEASARQPVGPSPAGRPGNVPGAPRSERRGRIGERTNYGSARHSTPATLM